jgi:hypothetical protein
MNLEQLMKREFEGETEDPGEKLLQCHFVIHKSLMT